MTAKARFITLEGVDGAGKSTHLETIAGAVRDCGHPVLVTREPGGTPLGEQLRSLILNQEMDLETETLLMFASRNAHLAERIRPALDAGRWVVSDRFTDATFAYQGGGRGLDPARIEALANWVHPGFAPDVTFLFDVPPETAAARLVSAPGARDRFEQESLLFFTRVRQCYLDLAARHPGRFVVIDARQSVESISNSVKKHVLSIG